MKKIDISNAPAYTSPNSMTLLCTEKPDGSMHTALAGGSWCGTERQRGGGSGSVLM